MTSLNPTPQPKTWLCHIIGATIFAVFLSFIIVGKTTGSLSVTLWVAGMFLTTVILFGGYIFARDKPELAPTAGQVIGWGLALRLLTLFGAAHFEDDFYRYLWDGYQTVIGANPYLFAPSKFFSPDALLLGNVPAPTAVAQALSALNNPDIPTIYGPALQWLFALAAWVAPGELWPIRVLWLGVDMWLLVVLVRVCGAPRAMLYALCPLVLHEVGVAAHPDAMIGALLFFACIAAQRNQVWRCGIFLGCAAAMKIHALLALPFLLIACGQIWPSRRSSLQLGAACLLTYAAFWLPFVVGPIGSQAAFNQAWHSFATFAREWQFNALGFGVLRIAFESNIARVAALAVMAISWLGILVWLAKKSPYAEKDNALKAALIGAFGALLVMSPVINAWYLLWLLPLAMGTRFITPWVAALVLPLSYLTYFNLNMPATAGVASPYTLPTAIPVIEGVAIGLALCWDCVRARSLIA